MYSLSTKIRHYFSANQNASKQTRSSGVGMFDAFKIDLWQDVGGYCVIIS